MFATTLCGGQFCPSTFRWVPEMELGLLGLYSMYSTSRLSPPDNPLSIFKSTHESQCLCSLYCAFPHIFSLISFKISWVLLFLCVNIFSFSFYQTIKLPQISCYNKWRNKILLKTTWNFWAWICSEILSLGELLNRRCTKSNGMIVF